MAFLNPVALTLSLLAILIVLAARRRVPPRRRAVANLHLWQPPDSSGLRMSLRKLRRDWLVVVQVLCVVLLALSLARPTVWSRERQVVLLIDGSASMGAREGTVTRLDLARRRAREIIARFSARTRVRLLAAKSTVIDLGEFEARDATLATTLERLTVSAGSTDLGDAIPTIRRANPEAILYVVSDLAPPSFDTTNRNWIVVGSPADNVAITALVARRFPNRPTQGQILVQLHHFGDDEHEIDLTVAAGRNSLATRHLRLAASAAQSIVFDAALAEGVISAAITPHDRLAVDDRRFAVIAPSRPVRVAFVGPVDFFIEKAVLANPLVSRSDTDPGSADVVVCAECTDRLRGRGGVLRTPAQTDSTARASQPLTVTAPLDPILQGVELDGLSAVPLSTAAPAGATRTLLRAGAEPALIAGEFAGRRMCELRLDVARSSVRLDAAFPVLIGNAVDWLASAGDTPLEIVAGEPLRWPSTLLARDPVSEIVGPDGAHLPVSVRDSELTSTATEIAGIYRVLGASHDHTFVVNPATGAESDLRHSGAAAGDAATASTRRLSVSAAELTRPLLMLAFAALLAEWLHVCRRSI